MPQMSVAAANPSVPRNPPRRIAARCARILIADDEGPVRDYLDRVLRRAGYVTMHAIDGQDALEVASQSGPFDMLITDELMPRLLGHEVARQLRQQDPELRVLYVTAYSDRLVKEKPAWGQHEARLDKPVRPDELLDAVSFLLRHDARIRSQFDELPGLSLTLAQAARLFDLTEAVCHATLERMVEAGLLQRRSDGRYTVSRHADC